METGLESTIDCLSEFERRNCFSSEYFISNNFRYARAMKNLNKLKPGKSEILSVEDGAFENWTRFN